MILPPVWCSSSRSRSSKSPKKKVERFARLERQLCLVVIILQAWIQGCSAGNPFFPAPEAGSEATGLARKWSLAVKQLDTEGLLRLFLDTCLLECRGFGFHLENEIFGGNVLRFSWKERDRHGSLAGDLAGHMAAYRKVERVEISVARLKYLGSRAAQARLRISVDGILITGHRRSDRGSVEVMLEKRGGARMWLISRFHIREMETLVSNNPGFRKAGVLNNKSDSTGNRRKKPLSTIVYLPDEETGVEENAFILIASGSRIDVWNNDGSGGWRRIQTLSTGEGEITGLQYLNVGVTKEPDLVVSTKRHGVYRFQTKRGPRPLSAEMRPLFGLDFLENRFGDMQDRIISGFSAFGDVDNGRLGFYLTIDKEERPLRSLSLSDVQKDFVFLADRGGRFESGEVVFPVADEGPARTQGLCSLGVFRGGNDRGSTHPNSPYMLKVTDRGTWMIFGKDKVARVSRSWDTGCLVWDFNRDLRDEWLVSGVGNPRPWMYDKPGFALPWRGLVSPGRWRNRIREAARGSVFYSRQAEKDRINRIDEDAYLHQLFSEYTGWVTSPQAVDLNGDGFSEITAIQKGTTSDSSKMQIFWGREFPRLWDSNKPLYVPEDVRKEDHRLILLKRNPDGTYSDLGFVLGVLPEGAGVSSISFGDIMGHGAMDMLILKEDGKAEVWANELPQKNSIRLRLKGGRTNPSAVGAVLMVTPKSGRSAVKRRLSGLDGGRATIGIGTDSVARVEVVWPDGFIQTWQDLSADDLHVLLRSTEQ